MGFMKSLAVIGSLLIAGSSCMKKPSGTRVDPGSGKRVDSPDGKDADTSGSSGPDAASEKKSIPGPNARELCKRPASASGDPKTIENVIALLNALPKPVSVACLIDVLARPLLLNATANTFSAQPAVSAALPRIFILRGDALAISVVPSGPGGEVVEFSYRTDATHSVKGELKFPVTETLAPDAAYTSILADTKSGTVCGACHSGERKAEGEFAESAFVSRLIKPAGEFDVSLQDLQRSADVCDQEKRSECAVLQALFFQGQVSSKAFP